MPLAIPDEAVVVSRQGLPSVAVAGSEVVFVATASWRPSSGGTTSKARMSAARPSSCWSAIPRCPIPKDPRTLDPKTFGGAAMTYYGRWTYKYDIAAQKGAAAAVLVHETGPAGYPYDVVKGSWGRENFGLDAPDESARHAPVDAWLTLERTRALLAACGWTSTPSKPGP